MPSGSVKKIDPDVSDNVDALGEPFLEFRKQNEHLKNADVGPKER